MFTKLVIAAETGSATHHATGKGIVATVTTFVIMVVIAVVCGGE